MRLGDSTYDDAHCELKSLTERPGWENNFYAICHHAVVLYTTGKERFRVLAGSIGQTGMEQQNTNTEM